MKKTILIILISISIFATKAQNSRDYIDEAYSLFKVKTFNPSSDMKKCDIVTYIRAGEKLREATYYIELKPNKVDTVLLRAFLDFNNMASTNTLKSYRQKDDVYELNFGSFYVSEYAFVQIIIVYNDGGSSVIPLDMSDYNNPITIMN